MTGTGMMIAAYAVSLLVVERLFKIVKPKLITLNWFSALWTGFTAIRDKTISWATGKVCRKLVVSSCGEGRLFTPAE
jgi:hypothetical protein